MMNKAQVNVIVGVAVVVFGAGIALSGGSPSTAWLRFYSYAVTGALVLLTLWDRLLWRTAVAQGFDSIPRNLNGTWSGELRSLWIDPATGLVPPPKPVYLVVRQTWSKVSVIMLTDEMRSTSSLGQVAGRDGTCSLDYLYLSRPDSSVEHRSRMHHGSTSLDISGSPPNRLRGRYWTDRDSKGELDFTQSSPHHSDDYDAAVALFET